MSEAQRTCSGATLAKRVSRSSGDQVEVSKKMLGWPFAKLADARLLGDAGVRQDQRGLGMAVGDHSELAGHAEAAGRARRG